MKDTVLRLVAENKLALTDPTEQRPELKLITSKKKKGEPCDSLVHRHVYRGFAVEIWQERATVGTQKPRFYSIRLNTAVTDRYPRTSRLEGFSTVARALSNTEYEIDRRRKVLDDPRYQRRMLRKRKTRPRLAVQGESAIIDYITGGVEPGLPSRIMEAYGEEYQQG